MLYVSEDTFGIISRLNPKLVELPITLQLLRCRGVSGQIPRPPPAQSRQRYKCPMPTNVHRLTTNFACLFVASSRLSTPLQLSRSSCRGQARPASTLRLNYTLKIPAVKWFSLSPPQAPRPSKRRGAPPGRGLNGLDARRLLAARQRLSQNPPTQLRRNGGPQHRQT